MLDQKQLKELFSQSKSFKVLYVEDDEVLQNYTLQLLSNFFGQIDCASNGKEGLDQFEKDQYDIVISDLRMPLMDGIEMVRQIKQRKKDQVVIITSAHDESKYLLELIDLGVEKFVVKPLNIDKFLVVLEKVVDYVRLLRLEKEYKIQLEQTVEQRTKELKNALLMVEELSNELMLRLITAAEYRDTDTGEHILRIGLYAKALAREMGLSDGFIEEIEFSSPLHDIGKIGIQDHILLKKGRLTDEEFKIMRTHSEIGGKMLRESKFPKIQMAEEIATFHHERFDGSGYPRGLKGSEIPLSARIVILCDQYDALMMKRPYKPSLGHEKSYSIITQGDDRTRPGHFDPEILEVFKKVSKEMEQIYLNHSDS